MFRAIALAFAFSFPIAAHAAEYRTVGESGAVLFDAPSRQATPLFVVSHGYPLEVIADTSAWVKVRDHAGALSWIERERLGEDHMVVVTAEQAAAHLRPDEEAPLAFVAVREVALQLVGHVADGWLRVRHADGSDGYLRSTLVWGE